MKIKNGIVIGALALVVLGVQPVGASALNLNLSAESEVKINNKIESFINKANDNDNKGKSDVKLNIDASKDEKKLVNLFRKYIKKDNKVHAIRINGESVRSATSTAHIVWKTNVSTEGYIKFNTNKNLVASSTKVLANASLNTKYEVKLNGLNPETTYYYMIGVRDANGNVKESKIMHFRTKRVEAPQNDVLSIVFSNTFNLSSTSASVIWVTNKPTNAKVWLSSNPSVNTSGTPTLSFSDNTYFHNVRIPNLAKNTKYYYVVGGADASGHTVMTSESSFTTKVD